MSAPTDQLLSERGQVHGEFTHHARITQAFKRMMQAEQSWPALSDTQRESLEMIVHKIGRVLAGNPDHVDHWDDIAGYARLVSQRIPAGLQAAADRIPVRAQAPASMRPSVPTRPDLSAAMRAVDEELRK